MNYNCLIMLFAAALALSACKPEETISRSLVPKEELPKYELEAVVQESKLYEGLPSASGIEANGNMEGYFVVGDDSPYLYQLDEEFNVINELPLFDTSGFINGRIPKAAKPDLESMARFRYGRDEYLLLLGSGSSPARNRAFLVNLSEEMAVKEVDLSRFYLFLRKILQIEEEGVLNLEGLAIGETYTYLMQRGVGADTNALFRFETDDFVGYLINDAELPIAALYYFELPLSGQVQAGFSGAYVSEEKLFFTASAEDTANAIEDGEVVGSYLGVIDLRSLPYATSPAKPLPIAASLIRNQDGTVYKGKAESLVVEKLDDKAYKVIVVSDDDLGGSELLEVLLRLEEVEPDEV
ncbi:hypothetical protein CLV24_114105 [Pontibacter ummariensis]|uniref:Uncharacterized protein n=2 Tax=Pontibacter ummariensis TaxID=1610492 RepID=A0A239HR63_9BACT|nr:hypothetical protein CLV24_114105 [Pontibacter ummariensis]SNS83413.1 hypothetical protein SAMN06296052_114105 [Pontibacter ummariensis]